MPRRAAVSHHLTPARVSRMPKRREVTSASTDMERREPCAQLLRLRTGAASVENSAEAPQEEQSYHTVQQSHFCAYDQRKWNHQVTLVLPVCCSMTHNSQAVETTSMSNEGQAGRMCMYVYVYINAVGCSVYTQ